MIPDRREREKKRKKKRKMKRKRKKKDRSGRLGFSLVGWQWVGAWGTLEWGLQQLLPSAAVV